MFATEMFAIDKIYRKSIMFRRIAGSSLLILCAFLATPVFAKEQSRPNIIWIMAEDIGCDLVCYGTPAIQTPVLDKLAAEGTKFNRAYCTSPICSTNRSAMMTGMYQTSIGAHQHRSHREDGMLLAAPVRPITAYLQEAGYFCAIGCGQGEKEDLNFHLPKDGPSLFNGNDWSQRAEGQPFFAHIQLKVTHRGDWWERVRSESSDPVDPSKVELPPYLPDHPAIRKDWAMYLDQIEAADAQTGEILDRLEREGLSDNTVVIFIGDNGRCFHRGKGFLFEDGIKVPYIIRWPQHVPAGKVSEELVSTIDISAQILALAGIAIPEHMQGRALLDDPTQKRDYVFAARDRWDEVRDKSRAVVGPKFKYIRNDMPEVPYFTYQGYLEKVRPIRPVLWEIFKSGKMTEAQAHIMRPSKPAEELYDLLSDPWETVNLAKNPEYVQDLKRLRAELERWEVETGDQGRNPEPKEAVSDGFYEKISERDAIIQAPDRQ